MIMINNVCQHLDSAIREHVAVKDLRHQFLLFPVHEEK